MLDVHNWNENILYVNTQRLFQLDLNAGSLKFQKNSVFYYLLNLISERSLVLIQQCDSEVLSNNTDIFQLLLDIYSTTSTPSKQTVAWSTLWHHSYCAADIVKCDWCTVIVTLFCSITDNRGVNLYWTLSLSMVEALSQFKISYGMLNLATLRHKRFIWQN